MEVHPVIKKLQWKNPDQSVLIVNAPSEYNEVKNAFNGEVHTEKKLDCYGFIQVFGLSNEQIQSTSFDVVDLLSEDGLLWLSYPKKSSKKYKKLDCNRDTVATLLAEKGFEPVRQIALDDDWSALRFRKVEHIKKMVRKDAVTAEGKKRVEQ